MSTVHLDFEELSLNGEPEGAEVYRARAGRGWVVITIVGDAMSTTWVDDPNFLWKEDQPVD